MKSIFHSSFGFLSLIFNASYLKGQTYDWENPELIEINKIPARASSISFPDIESARKTDITTLTRYWILNGTWKFFWTPIPDTSPEDFYKTGYDYSLWIYNLKPHEAFRTYPENYTYQFK